MRLSLLLLLINKDIRALRIPLLLMWAVMAWTAFVPFDENGAKLSVILSLIAACLMVMIHVQALQADAPESENFFSTKPFCVTTLIAAKGLLLLLTGVLPLMLVAVIQLYRAGLGFTVGDYSWKCVIILLNFIALLGIIAPVAIRTKTMFRFFLAVIACVLFWQILTYLSGNIRYFSDIIRMPRPGGSGLAETRYHLAWAVIGLTGYELLYGVYLRWNIYVKALVIAAGFCVAFLVSSFWPVNFFPSAPREKWAAAESALKSVEISYNSQSSADSEWRQQPGGFSVDVPLEIKNLLPPYYLQGEKVTSSVTLRSGKVLPFKDSYFEGRIYHPADLANTRNFTGKSDILSLLLYPGAFQKVDFSDLAETRIKGLIHYGVHESLEVGSLPLQEGAGCTVGGTRVRIARIEKQNDGNMDCLNITIEALSSDHLPSLHGILQRADGRRDFNRNLVSGKSPSSAPAPSSSNYITFGPASLRWSVRRVTYFLDENIQNSLSPEDVQSARLLLFQTRRLGSFTCPFHIEL